MMFDMADACFFVFILKIEYVKEKPDYHNQ